MVSTAEIASGDGSTGSLGASDATDVTDAAVDDAAGELPLTVRLWAPGDDPEEFAVESVEVVVCADTEEPASDGVVPALECFAPVLAPPTPTA
ncbi:hypothetical protein [Mycobacterium sp. EPa45]|uniref:hypothetical protein n=1 Tax=Mycobacterium sp. EPa45 TaxID=1545728 RepID=UPI000699B262|nr:hypothetical protein [Mycobacterium sp. EPa45]